MNLFSQLCFQWERPGQCGRWCDRHGGRCRKSWHFCRNVRLSQETCSTGQPAEKKAIAQCDCMLPIRLNTDTHPVTQSPGRPVAQSPNRPIAQSPSRPVAQSPSRAGADGSDAVQVPHQERPRDCAGLDDGVVGVPDCRAEVVLPRPVPDVLHRVRFWCGGGQGRQYDGVGNLWMLAPWLPSATVADRLVVCAW